MQALTLSFASTDARSIVRADVIVLAFSYVLLWPVMRGLPRITQAILLIMLAAMMMTPLALDTVWVSYRYVAGYNRWAWALYTVSMIWMWNHAARGLAAQISLSIALSCLLYLKLTIFCPALFCAVLPVLGDVRAFRDLRLTGFVLLVITTAGLACGFLIPYLQDNIDIAVATGSMRVDKLLIQLINPYNFVPNALAVLLAFNRRLPLRSRVLLGVSMLMLHVANLQNHDEMVPLIGLPLLLIVPHVANAGLTMIRPRTVLAPPIVQAIGLFAVAAAALVVQGHVGAALLAQPIGQTGTLGARISQAAIAENGWDVAYQEIRSAQQLTADLPEGTRVATLDVANIAVTAWPRLRPDTGSLLWYHYQRSFSDRWYPPPQEAFAGADVILKPRQFTTVSSVHLAALYQPWLDRCAELIAMNDFWRLYRLPKSTFDPQPDSTKVRSETPQTCGLENKP